MRRLIPVCLVLAACSGGTHPLPPPPPPVTATGAGGAFCDQLIGMSQQLAGLLSTTTTDFGRLAKLYAQLVPVAPPAIQPTVVDVVAALEEASDPARLADFDKRATADTQALTAYTRANC